MKQILIAPVVNGARYMYRKASTKAQRALLGYMVKNGLAADPILGGSFNLLCEVERREACRELYVLAPNCNNNVATEICNLAERAKQGAYDKYAFSNLELTRILFQIEA